MFDLSNIDFIKTDEQRGRKSYSFVGLKRKVDSERLEFWLPLGFDDFDTEITNPTSFDRVKNFFFKMYRTFQVYRERKLNQLTEEEKTKDRDGVFEFENGFSFVNENNEQVVFYGKLNALDKILEGYDELRISSLEKKQVRSHEIDYSKIHKYMHQAIYLEDDVIYLDEMNIAKNVLIQDSPPIIQLFCFIYTEIKKELEELDNVPDKAFELTDLFKENYLQPNSSLFAEDTFADTVNILKDVFEDIDNKTTYKDEDFWHFYEAVEAFLMGERLEDNKGIYFGINNFYDIWEDMCQTYILGNTDKSILHSEEYAIFADVEGSLLNLKDFRKNPFKVEINRGYAPRYIRPDLVLLYPPELCDDFVDLIYSSQTIQVRTRNEIIMKLKSDEYQDIDDIRLKLIDSYNRNPNDNFVYKNVREVDYNEPDRGYKLVEKIFRRIKDIRIGDLASRTPLILKLKFKIIDYKYMRQSDYQKYNSNVIDENGENKIKSDIHKQLIYEWTVQNNFENSETESEFWIPYYAENLHFETSRIDITTLASNEFKQSRIRVIKVNFKTLQENYVKLSNAL
ncbi:MAG: hypothetical protein JJT94_09555 [Bernardetiaceae bacterium]|nr:hypothetical protein [Bernardetiaceae bacterium]